MMKTALKKAAAVFCAALLILSLCGCDFFAFDTAELLSPPEPKGDFGEILTALDESITGEYSLVYPSAGNLRTPIIEEDIDGDGTFEALAFYKTSDGERPTLHINAIVKQNGKWKSVDDIGIEAGGVDSVEFCDLDGNGDSEILVGWEIYAESERQLAIYTLGKDSLSQIMLQRYTSFLCCDIDENGTKEVFLHDLNTTDGTNRAIISSIDKNGILQISGCVLDGAVKSASAPIFAKLSGGKSAIYIDETKGAGAITEVLYCENGELINGLLELQQEPFINTKTLRSSSIPCRDFDGDGIIEIPVEASVPNADPASNEKITYVNWCVYTGKELKVVETSIINLIDGYMINVPQKWQGNIAVLRDVEKHERTVYFFNAETQTIGEKIITFKAIETKDYGKDSGYTELLRTPTAVICAKESEYEGDLKLTKEELKDTVKEYVL